MSEQLERFLFEPQSWIPKADGNLAVARHYQNQVYPLSSYQKSDFDSFDAKLLLLSQGEWELLGFTVALSPFAGQIASNLNGRLRRAAKSRLSEGSITQLDKLRGITPPTFLLPPNCWDDSSMVASSGVRAVLECIQLPPSLAATTDLRFDKAPPAVANLTISLVEVLCQISLPTAQCLLPAHTSQ